MTKVSYNIKHNGRIVKNVIGYQEAVNICEQLGSGWHFEPVYKEFDPEDTPEKREKAKAHALKFAEKWAERHATA